MTVPINTQPLCNTASGQTCFAPGPNSHGL